MHSRDASVIQPGPGLPIRERAGRILRMLACLGVLLQLPVAVHAQSLSDLMVEKSGPVNAAAGADVTYTVVVTNLGPDDASNVILNDSTPVEASLTPTEMTFVSAAQVNGPAFTCVPPAVGATGLISCTGATLPNGASATFTFVMNIPAGAPAAASFTNVASASSDSVDPNEENNSGAAGTTVPATFADLSVTKTAVSETFPDSDVIYSINVVNVGPGAAQTVQLVDTLPGTMTFVSLTAAPGFACSTPAVGAGGTITCTIATLAAGTDSAFTLTGHVPAGTPDGTTFTNMATVSSDEDPTIENNESTVTTVVGNTDLAITVAGSVSVNAGAPLSYVITVTNNGSGATVSTTTVTSTLPAGASGASGSGSGWTCNAPVGNLITCSSNAFIGSGAAFPDLTVTMSAPPGPGSAQLGATVSSATDAIPGNNTASATTNIIPQADLSITKTGAASAVSGQNIVYTIVVTNNGPSAADNVTVSDPTPANASFVSNSGACASVFPCNLGTLNAGQSATITSTFGTLVAFAGTVTNTASAATTTADPNGANDSATASTTVAADADLSITKTAPAGPYLPGASITYTLTVSNAGPGVANGVTVTDVLPAGTSFVSATPTQGSCSGTSTVTCSIGTIANGGSASVTIVLTLPPYGSTVQNTASVTSTSPDTNGANNASTVAVAVVAPIPQAIPTLSEAGILMAGLMLLLTGMFSRRRKE